MPRRANSGPSAPTLSSDTLSAPTLLPSTPTTSSAIASSTPSFEYFPSLWNMPEAFLLNQPSLFYYQVPELPTSNGIVFKPTLFVCETTASVGEMDSANTWSVAQVPNDCGTCVVSSNELQSSTITFITTFRDGTFFFCLSNAPEYIDRLVCDSYGPIFSVKSSGSRRSRRAVSGQQQPIVTPVTRMPTSALSITKYSAGVLSIQGSASITATDPVVTTLSLITTVSGYLSTITLHASVTPSPATPKIGPKTNPKGISPGAKAGIAIAIVLLFIILLSAFFLIRRRKQRKALTSETNVKPMPPNTHELLTNANSHELFTKHNVPEMDEQNSGILKQKAKLAPVIASKSPENGGMVSREDLTAVHELDPKSHITAIDTSDSLPSVHEVESSGPLSAPAPTPPASSSRVPPLQGEATSSTQEPPAANEERERKVELLTDRINRIREEKERLERIQELKDLEEQTKKEILEAWRDDGERS